MPNIPETAIKLKRILRNLWVDLNYGGFLGVNINPKNIMNRADKRHRFVYFCNTDTQALQHIFEGRIKPGDVLVDVGCGKGRVINWWLYSGVRNRIIGIELNPDLAAQVGERLKKYSNVSIIAGDVVEKMPPDGTIFYLFNPFPAPVMEAFKNRLKEVYGEKRTITVLYYSPKYLEVFENDPAWHIQMETVGTSTIAPFPPLAVITLK